MKTVLKTLTVVGLVITIVIETGCLKMLLKELDRKDAELRSQKELSDKLAEEVRELMEPV